MIDSSLCACCTGRLEPAQELRFLVESATLDDPAHLARIRRMPAVRGRPVPVCTACHHLLESNAVELNPAAPPPPKRNAAVRTGVLATVGILSVGWLLKNLLLGPRA